MSARVGDIALVRDAVAARRVSAEEVVRVALALIERLDPALNAVVALRAEEAIAEARAIDQRPSTAAELGPLAGVPVLVKDLEDVAGMRTTEGSMLYAERAPAGADGLVPSRLRGAGGIIVGKANLPEFATEGYTSNLIFGTTRNPWAPDWSPGGSSGGSGAALAAGMVPIATATDGGGSIRIPAAFCGLVGIKPTSGIIGRRPIPDWIDLSTDGPLATSVADLRVLMAVEGGPVAGDPNALPAGRSVSAGRPSRVLATPRQIPAGPLPPEVAAAFEEALAVAEEVLGIAVERIEPGSHWSTDLMLHDWSVLATTDHVHRLGRSFVEANLERMHHSAREFMERGLAVTVDQYLASRRRRFEYVRELDELLGEDAVLLTPTMAVSGFLADGRLRPEDEPGTIPSEVYNTEVCNLSGHPAISVPAGVCPNGVPFGLQVIAPRFQDGMLLELAARWEERRGWPRVAPGYDTFAAALGLE